MTIEIILFTILLTFINLLTGFKRSSVFGCGLVGFSGKNSVNLPAIFFLMWHNAETRGKHATGIYTPNTGLIKKSGEALNFIKDTTVTSRIKADTVLMAHVRKATVGNIYEVGNAHPFEYENLVVQHNGTLDNYKELAKMYNLPDNSWKTDSQVLGSILSMNHKKNEPFKVLGEYEGAAAFVIYNKETGVLYAGHDKERPLFYGHIGEDMYISSIDTSLEIIGCTGITSFPEFVIHTIKDGKIMKTKPYVKKSKTILSNIKRLVATLQDLFIFNKDGEAKYFFNEDNKFTGIPHGASIKYLTGYWLRPQCKINGSPTSEVASLSQDKFYKVEEIIDQNSFYLIDDNNKKKKAYKTSMDLTYYIPIKGNKVTILNAEGYEDITLNKSYEVLYHRFGDDFVVINNDKNDKMSVKTLDCRVSLEEELENKHLEVLKEVNFTIATKADASELFNDADLDDDNDIPNETELLQDAVDNLILTISDEFDSMVTNPNFSADEDTTRKLIKLDAFISSCHDYKFLLNINQNTYKNFEVTPIEEKIC